MLAYGIFRHPSVARGRRIMSVDPRAVGPVGTAVGNIFSLAVGGNYSVVAVGGLLSSSLELSRDSRSAQLCQRAATLFSAAAGEGDSAWRLEGPPW